MNQTNFKTPAGRSLLAIAVLGSALALAACDNKSSNETAGQKLDGAIATTEQSAAEAKARADASASTAGAAAKETATDVKEAVKDAGATVAQTADDVSITAAVSAGLAKDADLSAIRIDVDTKGGVVSLKGPAPTAAAKARAEEIAKGVQGVSSVNNELQVKM